MPGIAVRERAVNRWDVTVQKSERTYPSWLEVKDGDGQLTGRFMGKLGRARSIQTLEFTESQFNFSIPLLSKVSVV